jgi:hypothetical protein
MGPCALLVPPHRERSSRVDLLHAILKPDCRRKVTSPQGAVVLPAPKSPQLIVADIGPGPVPSCQFSVSHPCPTLSDIWPGTHQGCGAGSSWVRDKAPRCRGAGPPRRPASGREAVVSKLTCPMLSVCVCFTVAKLSYQQVTFEMVERGHFWRVGSWGATTLHATLLPAQSGSPASGIKGPV